MITALAVTGHQHLVRRSPELPGVEVVRGVHIGPPPKWHFIPMVQIHLVEAGAARIWCCGRSHVVGPGDVVVNAPNHNPRIDQRLTPFASTLRVYLAPCLFDSLTRPAGGPLSEAFTLEVIRDWRAAQLLKALAQDIAEGEPGILLERELGELVEKAARLLRTRNKADLTPLARRPEIERARHLLQERFDQPVRLEELTQASGMSKFHLLRLFRDLVGKTPHAYQMHLRIARARELLDRGVRSVDVAFMCGFTDQSHFSRCFKEIVGYTPGKFARFA
ncbi:MAG: AraC family transcriptional regulator [Deltaproteobacteria bacterium]|nr:MAG: AraC family transcriptional regulator [Deltaproteobacteria bacterium]